jgi:methyl-accepting chemotaxis protein
MDSNTNLVSRLSRFFGAGGAGQDKLGALVRFALIVFGVVAVAYVATAAFLNYRIGVQGRLGALAVSLLTTEVRLNEMRRNEKDFLARKDKADLDKHRLNFEKAEAALAQARSNPQLDAESAPVIEAMGKSLAAYRKGFLAAAEQQAALGGDNQGLRGEMRKQARAAEELAIKSGSVELLSDISMARGHSKDFMLYEKDESVKAYEKVAAGLKQHGGGKLDPSLRQLLGERLDAYDAAFHRLVQATRAANQATEEARVAAEAVEAPLPKLVEAVATGREAAFAMSQYTLLATAVVLVAVLAAVGVLLWNARKSADAAMAERLAAQQKAEAENDGLNNSVISILQAVNQLSQRDLTARAPVTQDIIGTVSDSVNALADETSKVLRDVARIASNVEQASGKVKGQADLVSRTAEDERKSVAEVIGSLSLATQTMNQVATLAEQSNRAAERATQATDSALETVNGTVRGMDSIRETIAETEKRIKRLGDRSQEITGIVNLINTISERTHVLALNASMQAAVAGEAGRGFAVVAEEVQRLAESSRNATQQISTLVNNIQLETNETISTVNRTIGQVVAGSEQAQKAGEQMRLTQEITSQLVAQVQRIAASSETQKIASAELLKSVEGIGQSTERTAQQIEAQNRETETLLDSARRLVASVNVFKLAPAA